MAKKEVKIYLVLASFLILAYIAYLVIKPFIGVLLGSFILTYLFYPLYKKAVKITKSRVFSAIIITTLIVIIIILPMIYLARAVLVESIGLYNSGVIENTKAVISNYLETDNYIAATISSMISSFVEYIKGKSVDFLISIPSKIFHFLVGIYSTFVLFLVGEDFLNKAKSLLPTKKKDELVKHIGDITYSIVYGMFLTAIIEFVLALIVFNIIGTELAVLLALIIGFFAFIPFLGPAAVWIPYALIELSRNNYRNMFLLIILGIVLFLIETIIKVKIISSRTKVNPVVILIGTIGGIQLLGLVGMIVGPVLLSSITLLIKEYYPNLKERLDGGS